MCSRRSELCKAKVQVQGGENFARLRYGFKEE